ncbi:MAG: hypothetical protein EAZ92_10040 [Candidatus Kapaibacterium sp.]|nr:MAG: hypothetical protein EAZ92_10040 [Candidatus Kapabacteria bacterium]
MATFTFIPAPVIYSFWLSGVTNGDVITIDGINFDNASAVKFGDTVAASFTVVSPTRITAVVGNGKTGAAVVIGTGGVGSRSKFIYYAPGAGRPNPPIITSFSPAQGPDGTVVTINGLNFQGTDWFTTAVRIGDAPDGPRTAIIQSMTATKLVAKVNGGATGTIRVYTPAGVNVLDMVGGVVGRNSDEHWHGRAFIGCQRNYQQVRICLNFAQALSARCSAS